MESNDLMTQSQVYLQSFPIEIVAVIGFILWVPMERGYLLQNQMQIPRDGLQWTFLLLQPGTIPQEVPDLY